MTSTNICVLWQLYCKEDERWRSYSTKVCSALTECAALNCKGVVAATKGKEKFLIDPFAFVQTHDSGEDSSAATIRCLFLDDKKVWWQWSLAGKPLNYSDQLYLEQNRMKEKIKIGRRNFNLIDMKVGAKSLMRSSVVEGIKFTAKNKFTGSIKVSPSTNLFNHYDGDSLCKKANNELASRKKNSTSKRDNVSPPKKVKNDLDIKTCVIKGRAPVDDLCPCKDNWHVFEHNGRTWDCLLNQTNIANNNNKFYLIQLLESDLGNLGFIVWMRWGRVGYNGQNSLTRFDAGKLEAAKRCFENKFLAKTVNQWCDGLCTTNNFVPVHGKYVLMEMDYNTKNKPQDASVKAKTRKKDVKPIVSKLDISVQNLISLICDISVMEQVVTKMSYDVNKMPLGNITKAQVRKGFAILKNIEAIIDGRRQISHENKELITACSEFYTLIPHNFGMKRPPLIKDRSMVMDAFNLVEVLNEIQVGLSLIGDSLKHKKEDIHICDHAYQRLGCEIINLVPDVDSELSIITNYIYSTHGSTHSGYKLDILEVFRCSVTRNQTRLNNPSNNRMLLFHGSRMSNWAGILGQGLRIAPPEAPSTGYMFGKGVYFADMSSKSANYCWPTRSQPLGLLLLCEVDLGDMDTRVNWDYSLPDGLTKDSVMALGRIRPDPTKCLRLDDGTIVPMGPPTVEENFLGQSQLVLNYNEYIIYDLRRIKIRFLAKIKFNFI